MLILAISGSLRARSSNTELLRAAALVAPPGVTIDLYTHLGALPHFNPDVEENTCPPLVFELRERLAAADALLFSTPEYAHGVPGALKNALDWLVGSGDTVGKRIGLLKASARSVHANESLLETLRVMNFQIVDEACPLIPLDTKRLTASELAEDVEIAKALRAAIAALSR